ncbi:hypothetical protein C7B61_00220 [filamentous cyanobacterium CCP1]|nr:hypothetical protein C7B61_00220 [filamentous cyanobacterium CCP1]
MNISHGLPTLEPVATGVSHGLPQPFGMNCVKDSNQKQAGAKVKRNHALQRSTGAAELLSHAKMLLITRGFI